MCEDEREREVEEDEDEVVSFNALILDHQFNSLARLIRPPFPTCLFFF